MGREIEGRWGVGQDWCDGWKSEWVRENVRERKEGKFLVNDI